MAFKTNGPGCGVSSNCRCGPPPCWPCPPLQSIGVVTRLSPPDGEGSDPPLVDQVVQSSNACCGTCDGTYAITEGNCEQTFVIPPVGSVGFGPNRDAGNSCPYSLPHEPPQCCRVTFGNPVITSGSLTYLNYVDICADETGCLTNWAGGSEVNADRNILTLGGASVHIKYGVTGSTYWIEADISKSYRWLWGDYIGRGGPCLPFWYGDCSIQDSYRGEWTNCDDILGVSLNYIGRTRTGTAPWLVGNGDENHVYWGRHFYDGNGGVLPYKVRVYEFHFCAPERVFTISP